MQGGDCAYRAGGSSDLEIEKGRERGLLDELKKRSEKELGGKFDLYDRLRILVLYCTLNKKVIEIIS